ncbi:PTS transporter subunit EIIC [Saccharibacillus sp. CPCC 101409]|uniref:PTS transporter subunit EIIC n=1 Tax=Saccharibacillus sp. CPCC 101409 TaxID=3058041 RepID=UPI002671C49A|nr:PTS transporter subunit EIIC [Saccharibacillus sp. CPCC 101409]MDO3410957.1 PTS transporter subunit EIIC [Saccharibacillus sp. CPCC 101409]
MSKYTEISERILGEVGGPGNVSVVNHCATRLRLTVADPDLVDQGGLKSIPGVMGVVMRGGGELQVIIGPDVGNVYGSFMEAGGFDGKKDRGDQSAAGDSPASASAARAGASSAGTSAKEAGSRSGGRSFKAILSRIVDFISGTFVPVLPVLVAAGLVSAVLNIAVTFFGLPAEGGTYTVLTAVNNAGFYFLPIFIGYSAARKLSINPLMGMYLGAILVHSAVDGAEGLDFLGISIPQVTYNSSVIPVIIGVLFMALVDKGFDKIIHQSIKFFAKPLLTILVVTPVTLILLGPLGSFIGSYLAAALQFVNQELGWLSVGLMGALTPFLVMTGTNQALFPLVFASMADNGYDAFVMPGMLAANTAIGAAALAIAVTQRSKDTRALGFSAGLTGVMGITEPAIFGILLRFRKALIGAASGGLAGGVFAGIVGLKQYAVVSPGLAAIPTFIPTDGSGLTTNFWFSIATIAIAVAVSFGVTLVLSRPDRSGSPEAQTPGPAQSSLRASGSGSPQV